VAAYTKTQTVTSRVHRLLVYAIALHSCIVIYVLISDVVRKTGLGLKTIL